MLASFDTDPRAPIYFYPYNEHRGFSFVLPVQSIQEPISA